MSINPLDALKEENNLLKLFDSINGENRYVDFFNYFLENEEEIKQDIYKQSNNFIKNKFNYSRKDIIILELNKILKPMKLKCTNDTLSCKEVNEKFKSNIKLMNEWVKIGPAFICRVCKPSKLFETEDELRKHREESGHKSKSIWKIKKDKRLTIIENGNYIYTPTLELIEYSGILAELNEKLKSINLKLYIENSLCRGEGIAMLRFEPTFACYYCKNIYGTENELKECEMKCKKIIDDKIDYVGMSPEEAGTRIKIRDEINKGLDKTK